MPPTSTPSAAVSAASSPARRRARSDTGSIAARRAKGEQTRAAIVDVALMLAGRKGLEGLSIGSLAEAAGMSKSGVFAHFGSREELQIAVVQGYHAQFEAEVFAPSLAVPRGLPRLHALFERWVQRVAAEVASGCLHISGAVEFDAQPGPVRDALLATVSAWTGALRRAITLAVQAGHLSADTDVDQLLFEMHGLILALHHDAHFLRNPAAVERARRGFERLIGRRPDA